MRVLSKVLGLFSISFIISIVLCTRLTATDKRKLAAFILMCGFTTTTILLAIKRITLRDQRSAVGDYTIVQLCDSLMTSSAVSSAKPNSSKDMSSDITG